MSEARTYRHSPKCITVHERWKELVAEFEAKHPDYCRHCGGAGYFVELFKPAPGSGYLEDVYPCQKCEDIGKCALCGADLAEDSCERVCGCSYDDFLPTEPECFC